MVRAAVLFSPIVLLAAARPAQAQQAQQPWCPWGQRCAANTWQPAPPPPGPPRPPPGPVSDVGLVQSVVTRVGNASGVHLGAGLEIEARVGEYAYSFRLAATTGVDRRETGFRLGFLNFQFPLWQESLWQGGYIRWTLFNFGSDSREAGGTAYTVDTSVAFGYSIELSNNFALRLIEVGGFGGIYIQPQHPDGSQDNRFDGGLDVSSGLVFR